MGIGSQFQSNIVRGEKWFISSNWQKRSAPFVRIGVPNEVLFLSKTKLVQMLFNNVCIIIFITDQA